MVAEVGDGVLAAEEIEMAVVPSEVDRYAWLKARRIRT
jgi:hypothetical protein